MMIRFFIALLIFVFTLPVYAKDMQMEQIKQAIFKNAKTQISPSSFPQYDNNRIENLHALNSWQIVDNRTITSNDRYHYIINYNTDAGFNKNYIYNINGTLAYVDFIVYPSCIKTLADLDNQSNNGNNIYPYYVYRHDNRGYLTGVWYITEELAYFFYANKKLCYKCDMTTCADAETGQAISRYYH